jgi:hypothetical protein
MGLKNALNVSGGSLTAANVHAGGRGTERLSKTSKRPDSYPEGCVGANLAKRNYVKYLVERYNHYREADSRFGRTTRFHYSVLFKNIESRFKAPTYFIPESRFGELVDYLHERIDNTLLGRVNNERGIPNYKSFDEYVMQHMSEPVAVAG